MLFLYHTALWYLVKLSSEMLDISHVLSRRSRAVCQEQPAPQNFVAMLGLAILPTAAAKATMTNMRRTFSPNIGIYNIMLTCSLRK